MEKPTAGEWPDNLQPPDSARMQHVLADFWQTVRILPDLLARDEHLLADELTAQLRALVLEMMLALNGIQRPPSTRHLNSYLGDSQRAAIEKTLIAHGVGESAWIGRAVALTVIYQWYAPQLVEKYALTYPQSLEDDVQALLRTEIPDWPAQITTE